MTGRAEHSPRSAWRLFADRTFGPYLVGQALSNTGNWFHNVAAGIVVFELTGSSTFVGLVGSLQFAATLLLAPVAGSASDAFDRRRVLLASQMTGLSGALALAVAVALLGVEGLGGVWPVFAATAVIGIGYAFAVPTLQAYVPSLVPRSDLPQALAFNSITFNLARAIGPGLAGVLVATAGAAAAFGVNALSFILFAAVLWWLGRQAVGSAPPRTRGSPWAALALARRDRSILVVLLATAALGVATDPVNTLTPALAAELGGGAGLVGGLASAFGIGGTVAAPLVARMRARLGPNRQALAGLLLIGAGLGVAATAVAAWQGVAGMGLAGVGFIHAVATLNTTLQLGVEDAVRGRLMALWTVAFLGVRPVAAILDGALAVTWSACAWPWPPPAWWRSREPC